MLTSCPVFLLPTNAHKLTTVANPLGDTWMRGEAHQVVEDFHIRLSPNACFVDKVTHDALLCLLRRAQKSTEGIYNTQQDSQC